MAFSPGYFFNSVSPQMAYQTPTGGVLGRIHFNPLFPNELEDVTLNIKREIDSKMAGA